MNGWDSIARLAIQDMSPRPVASDQHELLSPAERMRHSAADELRFKPTITTWGGSDNSHGARAITNKIEIRW